MCDISVEKIIVFESGEKTKETINTELNDIDLAVEEYLEYDFSKFPAGTEKVIFKVYEEDFPNKITFSKFKNEWYASEYQFNFKGKCEGDLLFSIDGSEVEIAKYLFENIEKINKNCNLNLDIEKFKNKIEPDDFVIEEELINELNNKKCIFEFLDI